VIAVADRQARAVIAVSKDSTHDKEIKSMKKKVCLTILLAMIIVFGSLGAVKAEIIPPVGEGQFGLEAVVLCESLTVREEPNTASKAVQTIKYGRRFSVMKLEDGWAECILSDDVDGGPAGWVNAEYIVIDPAHYRTETKKPVYAWDDTQAPKVALLSANTTLPILKEEGDWLLVSLRGAVGWIER
jgi:hypothetical protein